VHVKVGYGSSASSIPGPVLKRDTEVWMELALVDEMKAVN
jgi:hypothetical protein